MARSRTWLLYLAVLAPLLLSTLGGQTWSAYQGITQNTGNAFPAAATFCPSGTGATPVLLTGFETGAENSTGSGPSYFDTVNTAAGNPPAVETAVKRNGARSLRINDTSGAGACFVRATSVFSGTVAVVRAAVRPNSLPATNPGLVQVQANAGNRIEVGYNKATNKWTAEWGSLGTVDGGVTVTAGTWYVIDMKVNLGVNPRTLDWRINGAAQTQVTSAEAASTGRHFFLGSNGTSFTYDASFDDVLVTETAADYPIGDGKVLSLSPGGAGTHSGSGSFQDDDSTAIHATSYQRLDDQPFGATSDYVK